MIAARVRSALLIAALAASFGLAGCATSGEGDRAGVGAPPPAAAQPANPPVAADASDLEHGLACPSAGGPIDAPIVVNQAENLVGVDLESGRSAALTALPALSRAYAPVWSPDGRTLAFAFFFAPNDPTLSWLQTGMICGLDRETGQGRILARGAPPVESLEEASWTPDGQSLVVTVMRRLLNASNELTGTETLIARYDLSPTGGSPGAATPLVRDAIRPALSPDGRRLAFIKLDMASPSIERILMVSAADGSDQRQLLTAQDGYRMLDTPRWSPDSHRLVVSASTNPTGGATPGNLRERPWLTAVFGATGAAAHGEPAHLWLVSDDGQQVRQITSAPLDDPHAAWGPVGQEIVYVTTLGAVISHDLDTKAERQLTQPGFAGLIDWKWQK